MASALAIAVIGTLLLTIGLFWLMGAKIQAQVAQLSDTLPATIENAKSQLSQNPVGKKLVQKASSPETIKTAKGLASTFFKTTFGVFGDIYVVLFLGIFFTVSPDVYKKGIVQLIEASISFFTCGYLPLYFGFKLLQRY